VPLRIHLAHASKTDKCIREICRRPAERIAQKPRISAELGDFGGFM
jgi:hypothetical protein